MAINEPDELDLSNTGTLMLDLQRMDMAVKLQGMDEDRTMFDDNTHPKPPDSKEEGITDRAGEREVDMMFDTPKIEDVLKTDLTEDELLDL